MKTTRRWLLVALILLIVAALGPAQGVVLNGVKPMPNEKYVMVTFLSGIEFWVPAWRGMQDVAKMYGVKAVYQGTEKYDSQAEATVLEQVIATQPTGIIVTAQNPDALKPIIDKAIDSGITTVMFDSDSPKSKRLICVEVNNYAAGAKAAREMARLTGGTGKVAIITMPGQYNLDQRSFGIQDTLKKEFPKMTMLGEQAGLGDYTLAARVAAQILQAHPDLAGIFSTGSEGGPGSVQAFREAGVLGKIKIVGFDIDAATIEGIRKGEIDATIVQGAYNMGYWAMQMCYVLAHGLSTPLPKWKEAGASPLPGGIDAGAYVCNKDNVQYFQTK
ncbi:MAG: substrate-binding domain-containing protein [Spirochaetia bacterium]|jgi:ribose transport system substrate-binding protein